MRSLIVMALLTLAVTLSNCGANDKLKDDSLEQTAEENAVIEAAPTPEELMAQKRADALTNPTWVQVDRLPDEWGGLYANDCLMAGPEDSRFFQYRDAAMPRQYYLSFIVYPKHTGHKPTANIVIIDYEIWQNEAWPSHFLLYGQNSYTQIERRGSMTHGLHQNLDGRPWDPFQHIQTEYRATDFTRWSVNLNNQKNYGSEPPCDPALAAPWQDIAFIHKKTNNHFKLQDIMK